MALTYDRRVGPELLAALGPGGWAHSLVELGRSRQHAMDLQLRGYADATGTRASLYVGLTKVLDLIAGSGNTFKLDVNAAYRRKRFGWRPEWRELQPAEQLASAWHLVDDYLERVVPSIGDRYKKEGAVQAAICSFESSDVIVIDREAVVAFSDNEERTTVSKELQDDLLDAVRPHLSEPWTQKPPTSLGGECDVMALSRQGELLAIEVKPSHATSGITWAPLQARHYTNLFMRWLEHADDSAATLSGMLQQRIQIGLTKGEAINVDEPIVLRPVLAIAGGYSDEAFRRMQIVRKAIRDAGLDDPPLEVKRVTLLGRLKDV